jgi:hypothetical protein
VVESRFLSLGDEKDLCVSAREVGPEIATSGPASCESAKYVGVRVKDSADANNCQSLYARWD